MTPVDGITPPKKNNINRPIKNKSSIKKVSKKNERPKINNTPIKSETFKSEPAKNEILKNLSASQKHKIIWLSSIIIVFIIFILWSSLIVGGKIYSNKPITNNNFLNNLSNELTGIWKSFKTDYLKIKNSTDEAKTEEERIKELQEEVFPNFDEYK